MGLMFFYFLLISFAACFLGGLIGIGGGIISVPLLMLVLNDNIELARTLSFFCILVLSIVGVIKYSKQETKPDWKLVLYGFLGVVPGVILGLFGINPYINQSVVIFNILLIIVDLIALSLVFIQKQLKPFSLNEFWIIPINFIVGIFSSVLGLGGGILFVPILYLCFEKDLNNIAPNNLMWKISIASISFFTSIFYFNYSYFHNLDLNNLWLLLALAIGGITGGTLGPYINKKLKSNYILWIYIIVVIVLIVKELVTIILNLV
ncbi:sulfite exporter TauE/SafE family protein [Spiroplasma endosymbiont of Amphibalanus improvisus]|uniref:sulfite exporter TauE/SafE family protein n=1 Tax=Spiroplasma endosymbiont of Amphibalanus improvisus TaxID=3066327 RepID=UPI00313ED3B0